MENLWRSAREIDFPDLNDLDPGMTDYYEVFINEFEHFNGQRQVSIMTRFKAIQEMHLMQDQLAREIINMFAEQGVAGP